MTTRFRVLAVAATLAVLAALTACTPDESKPAPTVSEHGETSEVKMGEPTSIAGWAVTVTTYVPDSTKTVQAHNTFNPNPEVNEEYVLVGVTMTREDGAGEACPFNVAFTLNGVTDAPVDSPNRLDLLAPTAEGATIAGNIPFALPDSELETPTLLMTSGAQHVSVKLTADTP